MSISQLIRKNIKLRFFRPTHIMNKIYYSAQKYRGGEKFKKKIDKKRKHSNHSVLYHIIIVIITIGLWIYFLFFSKFFVIKDWEIILDYPQKSALIQEKLQYYFSVQGKNNIFLFDGKKFLEYLQKQDIVFEDIVETKIYPNKIILQIKEKPILGYMFSKNNTILLSQDGTLLKVGESAPFWYNILQTVESPTSTSQEELGMVDAFLSQIDEEKKNNGYIFYDAYYNNDSMVGSVHLAKKVLENIEDFTRLLKEKIGIEAKLISIYKNNINPKIIIYTKNNWKILLGTENSQTQFYKFYAVFTDQINDINKPLEYIDLRFGERVYIK